MTNVEPTAGERMFHEIKTLEQGRNYILEIIGQVEKARVQCEESYFIGKGSHHEVERAYHNLLIRYGQGLGALVTLMHCRVLTDEVYNHLRTRLDGTLVPRVIAEV